MKDVIDSIANDLCCAATLTTSTPSYSLTHTSKSRPSTRFPINWIFKDSALMIHYMSRDGLCIALQSDSPRSGSLLSDNFHNLPID